MKLKERIKSFLFNYFLDYTPRSEKMITAIMIYYGAFMVFAIISGAFKITNQYVELFFYIIVAIFICSYYFIVRRNNNHIKHWPKRKMTIKSFLILFALRTSTTLVTRGILEVLYIIRGYRDEIIQGTVNDLGVDIDVIIKVVIIGPILEEILIRGTGLILFDKDDNKVEAITLTAIVFGLMHANIAQSISATLGGFILGYVAIEYGIVFSIVFHMLNNLLVYIECFFDIESIIYGGSIIIIIVYIIFNRNIFKRFKKYCKISKEFSFKRQLLHFINPFLLVYMFLWIMLIIEDIFDKG